MLCGSVFPDALPSWVHDAVPGANSLWAPDVSFVNGSWYLLYAVSSFGSQVSAIGLATSPTLNVSDPLYGWTDAGGPVQRSAVGDPYNAIDPCLFDDGAGHRWLAFGSFWGGVYATPFLAPSPAADSPWVSVVSAPPPLHLAQRPAPDAMEAAHLFVHGPHVYLLTSWGYCCRGNASTYEVCVWGGEADDVGTQIPTTFICRIPCRSASGGRPCQRAASPRPLSTPRARRCWRGAARC